MTLRVIPFNESDADLWDAFCASNSNATFLHSRRYLSYHKDRFLDLSLMIYSDSDLVGLIPIAKSKSDDSIAMSHPGISYGGIIHSGKLFGDTMYEAFNLCLGHLKELGYSKFIYRPIPSIYNTFQAQDDIFSLFKSKAVMTRCYLSSAINLKFRRKVAIKQWKLQSKLRTNIDYRMMNDFQQISNFWKILELNLSERYGTAPTHSLDEIVALRELFPENIELITFSNLNDSIAGLILYWTENVCHVQYMAANSLGRMENAMYVLIESAISLSAKKGVSFLDFGHSNENFGQTLNADLYKFKTKFGGGGVAMFEFTIEL